MSAGPVVSPIYALRLLEVECHDLSRQSLQRQPRAIESETVSQRFWCKATSYVDHPSNQRKIEMMAQTHNNILWHFRNAYFDQHIWIKTLIAEST